MDRGFWKWFKEIWWVQVSFDPSGLALLLCQDPPPPTRWRLLSYVTLHSASLYLIFSLISGNRLKSKGEGCSLQWRLNHWSFAVYMCFPLEYFTMFKPFLLWNIAHYKKTVQNRNVQHKDASQTDPDQPSQVPQKPPIIPPITAPPSHPESTTIPTFIISSLLWFILWPLKPQKHCGLVLISLCK